MRPIVIAGNWKMHTTPADAGELARTIASRTRAPGVTRVLCPPFVCLAAVRDAVADDDIAVGAQDVHHHRVGAFTGDIAASMLDGLATWVIVGHSERRRWHHETNDIVGEKLTRAIEAGLRPILCVGEDLEVREAGAPVAEALVVDQVLDALRPNTGTGLATSGLVIAYEPVVGDRDRAERERRGRGRDGGAIRDALDATFGGSVAGVRGDRSRSCTAAASRPRTSTSSSPSRRSTARSSAARRSSPTRWRASWRGRG